ncbi:MAG: cytochrome c oxidase accessory protein CcoG [Opitutales bacterium]|nr:cytochrome c oxidase accessory protein CcoG [Opitutales bacterium]
MTKRASQAKRPNLDSVTTINQDGSRFFLHPSDVSGRYVAARRFAAILLIAVYAGLPWIRINGQPAVFLDLFSRRFHLFGITFAAQEIWLAFFFITGLAFLLFFTTALFGRLWCGWACPQTVFLEHVYRRVERWIEGDAPARRRLDAAPVSGTKVFKRVLKHGVFILVSGAIAHLFLAYFVSIPQLYAWMTASPREQFGAFSFMAVSTGILYFNFAWFREQLCIVICPYGRLQSALIDEHTVNVAYDERRGEPRGKLGTEGAGDCIDCNRCVQVCPTGIDIRQGLQLECVACTACIDACDAVMDKVGRPRGLIRYASEQALEGKPTRLLRTRTVVYGLFMLAGIAVMLFSFSRVQPFEATVSRMTGQPYFLTEEVVRNQLQIRLVNKRNETAAFRVFLEDAPPGMQLAGWGEAMQLEPYEERTRPFILVQPREQYTGRARLDIVVESEDGRNRLRRRAEFVGPDPRVFQ